MASSTDRDSSSNPLVDAEKVVDINVADQADQAECHVHSLTAKFFLNRPLEDFIPAEYIKRAEKTSIVQRPPWIFRCGVDNPLEVDQSEWSILDIRFRAVFRSLCNAPTFDKGLWEGGSETCGYELHMANPGTQAQVVYALMNEVVNALGLYRKTRQRDATFFLRPRVLPYQLEYWTGFRERYHDVPLTSGCLSIEYQPFDRNPPIALVPVSTTMQQESFTTCLEGKFKLLLAQLLIHARSLPLPADKIPDQEVFLIGLHGSKLHLMRAFFPSQKLSSIWCRREVPGATPIVVEDFSDSFEDLSLFSSAASPDKSHKHDIGDTDVQAESRDIVKTEESTTEVAQQAPTNTPGPEISRMELFERKLQQARLAALDNELDLHTFRVLCTREYDLWNKEDFKAAVHIFAALQMYLLSGNARCGVLMETFRRHPIHRSTSSGSVDQKKTKVDKKNVDDDSKSASVDNKSTDVETKSTDVDNKGAAQETKPDATTEHGNTQDETYLDSDSDLSTDGLDEEDLYDEIAKWDVDEGETEQLAEKADEEWCEELFRNREDEETQDDQAVGLLNVQDDLEDFLWTGEEAG